VTVHEAYNSGYLMALSQCELLEKEAGLKDKLKNLALAGLITTSTFGGANKGMRMGMERLTPQSQKVLDHILAKKVNTGDVVDVDRFLAQYAPNVKRVTPREYAGYTVRELKETGEIPKHLSTQKIVNEWMDSPLYKSYEYGVNAKMLPEVGIVSGKRAPKSMIAHEIGHSKQDLKSVREDSAWQILSGKQKNLEQDAWVKAKQIGIPIDKKMEQASLGVYDTKTKGARVGAVGGGAAGAAGGLSLWGLAEILALLKRRKVGS